ADKTHLKTKSLPHDRVQITEREVPLLFEGTVRAVCAPLVASGQLFGMITLEYPEGLAADLLADDRQLIQLANQVAVGVRNAKLIEELTFMRKRLEDLVEHANALILVVDRERRVVMFNRALERATGLSKDRVLGRDLLTLAPESEGLRLMRVTGASLRGEEVPRFETRLLGQDGQEIRVSFATSTLLKPNGAVEGVIAIGQDLTATKELERRIIQAEKLASLGQLAASVVHEINNPMTAVATYADSLLQAWTLSAPPSDVEKLRKIMGNADRILRFTRDLVSYARPAQDRPAEVNLHQIIDLAAGFCDHELAAHRITVVREFDTLPPILAVKGDLIQVFVNLITNACHAMPQGGTLRLATVAQGARVAVRIQDEGTGIDPRNRERIFEPFFTTKPDGKGTGLGLSIVEDLVEKHGGDLEVESEMGVGTTFTIRLPVNVPAE
ncbi:MAG TPA: ATP-binding protein, partial [Myxococcaceae bacterium]|nr:ATP-binding protein [Myxococcaceae bacterium]